MSLHSFAKTNHYLLIVILKYLPSVVRKDEQKESLTGVPELQCQSEYLTLKKPLNSFHLARVS